MVFGQPDGVVEAAATGVERHSVGRLPDRLEMPRKVVCRRKRTRLVDDAFRLAGAARKSHEGYIFLHQTESYRRAIIIFQRAAFMYRCFTS